MLGEKNMSVDVYIEDYRLRQEHTSDILDFLENQVCPVCKSGVASIKPGIAWGSLKAGESVSFTCPECNITIAIESWEI